MKITSIRMKVLIALLPFFVISFGILSAISYYYAQQYLTKSVNDTARAMGTDYANRIQADIMEVMGHLEELANYPAIRAGSDQNQIVATLADFHKRIGKFDSTNFIYLSGLSVRMAGDTVALADREYFKKIVETKKSYVSKPLLTKLEQKPAVVLAAPVFNNGQLIGVVMGTYPLDKITELMKHVKFKDTGYGFVVDKEGLMLAHPGLPGIVGKLDISKKPIKPELKLKDAELDDKLMTLFQQGVTQQVQGKYAFEGAEKIGVFTPINLPGGQGWEMIVTAPESEVTKELGALTKVMLFTSLLFIFLAALYLVMISTRFAKPIQMLRDECVLLSQGDFRKRQVNIQGEDEIGELMQGFQAMKEAWRSLVTQVQSQAEDVAGASEELTASAQQSAEAANQVAASITQVAQGSEKQVSAATQIKDAANQMSSKSEQVSVAAREVADIANTTAQGAEQGSVTVKQAIEEMNQIGQGSEAVQTAISELSKGSQEISEIVTLIASIAGQTNLLALNAAIEAARAGEHGRGFAVVAEEVRKLAEGSNQAAQQIGTLIQKNQTNMDQAVIATQAGTKGVKSGIAVVNSAGETFNTIVTSIMKLSKQIKDISESINQMAAGSKTMVSAIEEITTVSQETSSETQTVSAATEEQSAALQEIAASSQSLANLAADLQGAVVKFRV